MLVGSVDDLPSPLPEKTLTVLNLHFSALLPASISLASFNTEFLVRHADSPRHVHAGLRAQRLIAPNRQGEQETELQKTLVSSITRLEDARAGLDLLREWKASPEALQSYQDAAAKRFPLASGFVES